MTYSGRLDSAPPLVLIAFQMLLDGRRLPIADESVKSYLVVIRGFLYYRAKIALTPSLAPPW